MQLLLLFLYWLIVLQSPEISLKAGDKLPPCVFYNASGETIYTDSLKGNVVVIDIWASWNAPSRRHNVELIKLYEKYRQQNFRKKEKVIFLSISLDTQRDLWLITRAKDDLHWPHNICDFKGWESDVVKQLSVVVIPSNFVVDRDGNIIARNMWGLSLDSTLKVWNK